MKLQGENVLLRIYLDTAQVWHHRPVYEVIVEQARQRGMAGATVLDGLEGFGQRGQILKDHRWALKNTREMIVEIVDTQEKTESFLTEIEPMLHDTIVTLERAQVVHYRHDERKTP